MITDAGSGRSKVDRIVAAVAGVRDATGIRWPSTMSFGKPRRWPMISTRTVPNSHPTLSPARKLSLRRGRSRRPRLRNPEPIEELHRDIRAGTHRFVVRTLHIDCIVALLDAEMGGFGGRRRALAARTAGGRLRCLPSGGGWTARLWRGRGRGARSGRSRTAGWRLRRVWVGTRGGEQGLAATTDTWY